MTDSVKYRELVESLLSSRQESLSAGLSGLTDRAQDLAMCANTLVETLRSGHKVLVAGNGGSAAEAQHFAAELVGRFLRERAPLPAISLTADSATVTALANDYGYENMFARQVEALGQSGDLLVAFSTSGESDNLIRAASVARKRGMRIVTVTGAQESSLSRLADHPLLMPAGETPVVQELHMLVTHLLCELAEEELSAESA